MSHRGELKRLAEIAEPEVGVVTQVAPVHLEFFRSVDEIALAKRELIEGLAGPDTVAVLNADDARVARFAEAARGRVLTFGFSPSAQFRAENVTDHGAEGAAFDFISPQGRLCQLAFAGRIQHCQRSRRARRRQRLWVSARPKLPPCSRILPQAKCEAACCVSIPASPSSMTVTIPIPWHCAQ